MKKHLAMSLVAVCLTALALTGCKSTPTESAADAPEPAAAPAAEPAPAAAPKPAAAPAPAPAPVAAPATTPAPAPKAALPTIRIRAGSTDPLTDSAGNAWLPDQGFDGGDTIARADDLPIANTQDPALYRVERYSMLGFTHALPNGKYVVKLHFAETFEGISGPGQRVFSFNVEGQEFKDFDVWVKAGGPERAYVEAVDVEITDGKLDITFTPNMENPEINGIEIIPAS